MKGLILISVTVLVGVRCVEDSGTHLLFQTLSNHFDSVFNSGNSDPVFDEKVISADIAKLSDAATDAPGGDGAKERELRSSGEVPGGSRGHSQELSQIRVIQRGDVKTIKKVLQKKQTTTSVERHGEAVDDVVEETVDIAGDDHSTKAGSSLSNLDRFHKRVQVRKIIHDDRSARNDDFKELIINDSLERDFDHSFADGGSLEAGAGLLSQPQYDPLQGDDGLTTNIHSALADLHRLDGVVPANTQQHGQVLGANMPNVILHVPHDDSADQEFRQIANDAVDFAENDPLPPTQTIYIDPSDDSDVPTMGFGGYPPFAGGYPPMFAYAQPAYPQQAFAPYYHPLAFQVSEPVYDAAPITQSLDQIAQNMAQIQNTERSHSQQFDALTADIATKDLPSTQPQPQPNPNANTVDLRTDAQGAQLVSQEGNPVVGNVIDLAQKEAQLGLRSLFESVSPPPTINPPVELDLVARKRKAARKPRELGLETAIDPEEDLKRFSAKADHHIKVINDELAHRFMKKIIENDFKDIDVKETLGPL